MKATNFVGRFLPICRRCFLLGLFVGLLAPPALVSAQTVEWIEQLGTDEYEISRGVCADGLGNVFVVGYTSGVLGESNAGDYDAFVSKYDDSGSLQWTAQLGTGGNENGYGLCVDGLGHVLITGGTSGPLGGPYPGGLADAFVSKFNATTGTLVWTQQLGSDMVDRSRGVCADALGNVYISGYTRGVLGESSAGGYDAFVSKYDAAGTLLWTEQLGSSNFIEDDFGSAVSVDGSGNVYIAGEMGHGSFSSNPFVSKYDSSGTLVWTRQLEAGGFSRSYGVSTDGLGNIYISGEVGRIAGEEPPAGGYNAFVSKYHHDGTLLWTTQLGGDGHDVSRGVSVDGLGNIYIAGYTSGDFGGAFAGGPSDAFVSKLDDSGTLLWTEQLGTNGDDRSYGVSADGLGNVYFSGYTNGDLGGPNAGSRDVFVGKISDVPEPSAMVGLLCLCLAGWFGLLRRK